MGWTDGGCFGSKYYRTPNLDKLAASGMRFTQAYAACAVCSPTRSAIMTGKYPARLHITDWIPGEKAPKNSRFRLPDWQQHLPLEETTIAEALNSVVMPQRLSGNGTSAALNFTRSIRGLILTSRAATSGAPLCTSGPMERLTPPTGCRAWRSRAGERESI